MPRVPCVLAEPGTWSLGFLTSLSWALSSGKQHCQPRRAATKHRVSGRDEAERRREARTTRSQMTHRPSNS